MPQEKSKTFTISNVHIFSPKFQSLSSPKSVHISNGKIVSSLPADSESEVVDGSNCTLLPGLTDAHVHLSSTAQIKTLAQWGITSALDMACWPPGKLHSLREYASSQHLTDFQSAGLPATAPGSRHAKMLPLSQDALLPPTTTDEECQAWVEKRIEEGSDYIKVIADNPGPTQGVLNGLTSAASKKGKMSVVHAARVDVWSMALESGADVVTHVPMEGVLSASQCEKAKIEGRIAVPTLTMMEGLCWKLRLFRRGMNFNNSLESVTNLHKAGVEIVAGTDANASPIMGVPHGESLHHELELLTCAGLTRGEVLRSATLDAATAFGLGDRGVVEVGKRADLVLVEGDPLEDIKATRNIRRVWIEGVEVDRTELESWWDTTTPGRWLGWIISFVPGLG